MFKEKKHKFLFQAIYSVLRKDKVIHRSRLTGFDSWPSQTKRL